MILWLFTICSDRSPWPAWPVLVYRHGHRVCDNPTLSKSTGTICSRAFLYLCLCVTFKECSNYVKILLIIFTLTGRDLWCGCCKKMTTLWRVTWCLAFSINKLLFIKVCTFSRHNTIAYLIECSGINTIFIYIGKSKIPVPCFIAIFTYCSGLEPNPPSLQGIPVN